MSKVLLACVTKKNQGISTWGQRAATFSFFLTAVEKCFAQPFANAMRLVVGCKAWCLVANVQRETKIARKCIVHDEHQLSILPALALN
jgi:hypothetical protein